MSAELAPLTGPQKAVLMLLSMEEATAVPVLAEMSSEEVQRLRTAATNLRSVPVEQLGTVYREFIERSQAALAVPRGGVRYLEQIAERALGPAKSEEIFSGRKRSSLERLEAADPAAMAAILEHEHPQLVAAILSQMQAERAAEVITRLPEEKRPLVLLRLGTMTEVPASIVEEIAGALTSELPSVDADATLEVRGLDRTAAVIRKLGRGLGEEVLDAMAEQNDELADAIRQAMYTFEDLSVLNPASLRLVLEGVASERLTLALKTAPEPLKNAIFASMSRRAADRIREDMEMLGAVRLADVEAAQREIVEVATRLMAEGSISLDGDEDVA
ncbi:MAG: flagellar motor switch protein FliG [Sorangiineae bacterium NIC37A_2]|mgnify:CR=1 FL=1|jgi:flagellar motor switch protein FliG|nr:MAG: flagellar motor switch protein FliG [Sorangiineae bacterium NIC37A_2]